MNSGIIRTVRDRDHPYIITNKTFALDKRLTWEARGMMIYLLAQPDNWQIQTNDLIKQSPAARDKVYRILKELESLGYVQRTQEHDEQGRFVRQVTTVYEIPQATEPETEKAETVEPETEKADLNKYRDLTSNEITKERDAPAPQDATPAPQSNQKRQRKEHPTSHLATLSPPAQEAIKHYQSTFSRYPSIPQMDHIAAHVTDLDRWKQTLEAWMLAGWSMTNVGGMVDRYRQDPMPQRSNNSARQPVKQSAQYKPVPEFDEDAARRRSAEILKQAGLV